MQDLGHYPALQAELKHAPIPERAKIVRDWIVNDVAH